MYRILTRATSHALERFYRIRELGEPLPERGPLLLVANHPNGLVDPLLVARFSARPVRFLAMAPIFDMPVLGGFVRGLQALPVYRAKDGADTAQNAKTFDAVHAALRCGEVVCLFPEGISHSFPSLQRLKTGAARMALGAEAGAGFELDLRIVPVGLVYRDKDAYHSEASTWVGEAILVDELRLLYERDERAATEELTRRIARSLRQVTINMERWEDLPLLEMAEGLWRARDGARAPRAGAGNHPIERLQRLAGGLHYLRENMPERALELTHRLDGFRARLDELGLSAEDLHERYTPLHAARFVVVNLLALFIGVPLALLGLVLWCVPYGLVRLSTSLRPVREDFRATVKIFACILFFPLFHALWTALAWLTLGPLWALGTALVAPFLGPLAVQFWMRRTEALEDAAVFLRMLRSRSLRERLLRRRDELAEEIEATSLLIERQRLAPQV